MSHEAPGIGPGLSSKVNDVVSNSNNKPLIPGNEAPKFMGRKQTTVQIRNSAHTPASWDPCSLVSGMTPRHLPSTEGLDSLCPACLYPAEG